jgi:hypothetical protein
MSDIRKYSTVSEPNLEDLELVVNQKIQEGWQPFGNLLSYKRKGKLMFCQPLATGWENLTDIKAASKK